MSSRIIWPIKIVSIISMKYLVVIMKYYFSTEYFYLMNYFPDEVVGFVLPLKMMTLEHSGHIHAVAEVQATGFINIVYSGGLMKNKLETHLLLCSVLNATPNI